MQLIEKIQIHIRNQDHFRIRCRLRALTIIREGKITWCKYGTLCILDIHIMHTRQVAYTTCNRHITLILDSTRLCTNSHTRVGILRIGHKWHKEYLHTILCHQTREFRELHIIADDNTNLTTVGIKSLDIAKRIIKMYKRVQTTRKEQDVLKRQLTQNIAHELKTPVASIQGYLETILDNPHINEQTKEQFLQRCYAQSERLTSLLHDISTLNRLDDGSDMIDFEAVDITQMVNDITKETALARQEHKMTFDNQLPERIVVKGNRSLLYSVFRNLTDNAIAYAGEGRTMTLEAKEQGNKWHFIFRDNGQGVPPEHLARLFERFYRVDKGRSRKMGGTGLGLAIVKNAVLLHGGTIRVSNLPEGGLKFEFTIKK